MRARHVSTVGLFASFVVLVTIAIHSANGLPIDASKRQEIVLSIGDTSDGGADKATTKPVDNSDATDSSKASAAPTPQIGKLLITSAALAVASEPMASWSGPLIGSGKFHPMPLVSHEATEQSDADERDAAAAKPAEPKPVDDASKPVREAKVEAEAGAKNEPADDTSKPAEEAKVEVEASAKNGTTTMTPPDADKLKDISDALAKVEDKFKLPDVSKTANAKSSGDDAKSANATSAGEDAKAATPPKRRSMIMEKRSQANSMTKRSKYRRDLPVVESASPSDKAACSTDQNAQTFVPVTYTELRLIKLGQYKVQPSDKGESTCEDGKVLLVPVSEEAMMALQQGLLQLTSAGTEDTVILETIEEAKSTQQATTTNGTVDGDKDDDHAAGTVSTPGPSYNVVPVNEDGGKRTRFSDSANKEVRIKLEGLADNSSGAERKRQTISRREFSIANVEHAGPTVMKRALADHIRVLEKRVKPSGADNTTLFGNGKGKLKYGHKIHYNAGASDVIPGSTSVVTVFAVLSVFALAGNFQL